MQPRRIILAVAGVGVLGLVLYLLLAVNSDSRAEVPADKRAQALAEFERRNKLSARAAPVPEPPEDLWDRRRAQREAQEAAHEAEAEAEQPEVAPVPTSPARVLPRAAKLQVAQPRINLAAGAGEDDETKEATDAVRKAYDTGNYPAAQELALEAVKNSPRNIKLLRYIVSSSCAIGEGDVASQYLGKLPKRDQRQMQRRCERWGVDL